MTEHTKSKRSLKDYLLVSLKGLAMGAADVVPGVSGGTIAFISGIYEELINSLKSFNSENIKGLFQKGIKYFWRAVNANFLLALVLGIGISILSLASILKHILETQPVLIWGFFFGLIIASAIYVSLTIKRWNFVVVTTMLLGVGVAYAITEFTPAQTPESLWFIFLSGALAICAMILPGISGAFILLLLGKYQFILSALSEAKKLNWEKITALLVFLAGAGTGLLLFSNVLSWLLKKFREQTVALLAGFMIGSLNKVWPWKETLSWRTNSEGHEVPLIQDNVLPATYSNLPEGHFTGTSNDPHLLWVILLAAAGFLLIVGFEYVARRFSTDKQAEN